MAIEASVWIYWGCCLIAASLVVAQRGSAEQLLGPRLESPLDKHGYKTALSFGWVLTLMTAFSYVLFTRKFETGPYSIGDIVTFSLLNGVLEQFMFIFWFLCGCYLGKLAAPANEKWVFASGYLGYFCFSGPIHAFFWVAVLPAHLPVTSLMVSLLAATSLAWMWAFWRYRAVGAIVAMHAVMDFLMIGHLHTKWFEPHQLL